MQAPVLSAAALGLAALSMGDAPPAPHAQPGAAPVGSMIGAELYGSAEPIRLGGPPTRPEDLALEPLGRVAAVLAGPDGRPDRLVVAVGGLWGVGAAEVEVGIERVRLLDAAGGPHVVVDLSAAKVASVPG